MQNVLGKEYFKLPFTNAAQFDATKLLTFAPTDIQEQQYCPFNHLILFNTDATSTLEIRLDTTNLGDDTFQSGNYILFLRPSAALVIEPSDNILFNRVTIKNADAANNIAANGIRGVMQNW